MEMPINNLNIHIKQIKSDKPVIVFIHGNTLSSEIFIKQLEDTWLAANYNLIALDLPGYGGSDNSKNPEKDYSEVFKSFLNEFYKSLNIKDAVFVGHSMGGNILLQSLDVLPNPKAIVILGLLPLAKPFEPECALPNPAVPLFFQEILEEKSIQLIASSLFKPNKPIPEKIIEIIKRSDPLTRKYIGQTIFGGNYSDEKEILKNATLPILMVQGEKEQLVDIGYLGKWDIPALWKNKIHTIPASGHLTQYENPAGFNKLFKEFLIDIKF